jgi:methionyl-tRNA synthetase
MKPFLITTPIYYVNDVPHIGHAYTTVAGDVLARWRRLRGDATFYLTGTDEHGAKISRIAEAQGLAGREKDYVDGIVEKFRALWTRLLISNDDFIRTTDPRHERVVGDFFARLQAKGDIYLGTYEDWYCVPCETFWADGELKKDDGMPRCPTCGRNVDKLKEESYFFKLSAYEQPLLAFYRENPDFLQPAYRASEIVNFVRSGLKDLSVSRTKVRWGIPVPANPAHTIYVWFDALINYISAFGDPWAKGSDAPRADVHLVGKEIFRFHAVIWPAMLMAAGLPLPRQVFAHGWWTVEGQKMSKSAGNVVDPHRVADDFGVDALRYFLLREVPFGSDGDFSQKGLLGRYNAELANALGNLLNRTLNVLEKNFGGRLGGGSPGGLLPENLAGWVGEFESSLGRLAFSEALEKVQGLVNQANKFIDEKAPWKLVKTDAPAAQATDRKSTRLNSSHRYISRMPSSA